MSLEKIVIQAYDLATTDRLGRFLAERLPDGSVVSLVGTLGAGKTRLVQAVAGALNIDDGVVSSPTFVLLHEYRGQRVVYHFDAYRLATEEEFFRLSPDDCFEGGGLTFVEWGDKFPDVLPREHLEIRIDVVGERERRFVFSAVGSCFDDLMKDLRSF